MGVALDEPRENEQILPADGIDILVSDEVKPYASGSVLEWTTGFMGEGFVLRPASGHGC